MTIKTGMEKFKILFLHIHGLKYLLNLASSVSRIVFYTASKTFETWQILINFFLYLPALR